MVDQPRLRGINLLPWPKQFIRAHEPDVPRMLGDVEHLGERAKIYLNAPPSRARHLVVQLHQGVRNYDLHGSLHFYPKRSVRLGYGPFGCAEAERLRCRTSRLLFC